jgi:phosphopantetheinyl transferase
VAALEATAVQAHEQLVASSELIKALAEQNAQFIQRIETNRVRVMWLAGVALLGAVTGVISVTLWLTQS